MPALNTSDPRRKYFCKIYEEHRMSHSMPRSRFLPVSRSIVA